MRIIEEKGFKFYCREYPRFDDEFCVMEVVRDDVYKLKKLNIQDGLIIDIGANIGTFAIPASRYGKVLAYEPDPNNFQILKMNIALNNANVEAFNVAVGKKGEDCIENASGHSRLGGNGGSGGALVKVIEFNDIPFEYCDLLKMDCEGGEYDVIKYANNEKLNKVARIVGELHSWIFEDLNKQREHKELIDKLEKHFDMYYNGFKNSNFKGDNKMIKGFNHNL